MGGKEKVIQVNMIKIIIYMHENIIEKPIIMCD